ncbi:MULTISPECIES: serine hydrolase domain-containing protein [Hyphobacterium]|uniref:Serine hydrolase domain-containing protein n=1 Tax=Hyphobacterium vulgare TaxID=1736751 RepID=A0ABV6ZY96_9PROT
MTRTLLVLLASAWACVFAVAAAAQTALTDLEPEFDALMGQVIERGVPGAILRIENETTVLEFARGVADLETGEPIRASDLIRMGSVTKLYTAAVIHALVGEGELDLDCPAANYLPAATLDGIANGDTVTLRQLLNHTGGVPDFYDEDGHTPFDLAHTPLVPELVLETVRGEPATNAPGEAYHYSNTGYHILALVAEAVTGEAMDALYRRHVFEPAGLQATQYETLFTETDRIHGYSGDVGALTDHYRWLENTGPDGGMLATTADISALLGALFTETGSLRDIGAAMLSQRVEASRSEDYGLGVSILKRRRTGEEFHGHTGGIHGYLTIAVHDPQRGVRIVLHINSEDEEALIAFYGGVLDTLAGSPALPAGR